MAAICIYPHNADDFSTNGLGILTPTECTVTEEAAGMYELELTHPIDSTNRWAQIVCGAIIKAPAPVRESPLYEEGITGAQTVVNQIYKTTKKVKLRQKASSGSKKLASIKKNNEVIVLENTGAWSHVMRRNGQVGYLSTSDLLFVREETSTVTQTAPVGVSTVHIALSRDQLFRVYSVETDSEAQTVHAKAMHIFYDLRGDLINMDYNPVSIPASEVVETIAENLMTNEDFEFHADGLSQNVNGEFGYKSPVEALLDPDEGVVHAAGALFLRDNYDVFILPDYVRDRQVTVRRGKNLVGVTATNDDSNVVTRILPFGKDVTGNDFTLDGSTPWVDSEHIGEYPTIRVKRISYDVKLVKKGENNVTTFRNNSAGQAAARAKMTELAQKDFANGADLTDYGMDVDFVILQNAEGFEQYASLQAIHLYDTVTVIDSMVGIRAKVRCTGYTWNCLTEQYDEITLGKLEDLKTTVYSFNLPTGGVSGTKIAPGTADGAILRDLSVQYAKISVAAVDQLSADSIVAQTAHINELTAQSIDTDELTAAFAHLFQLIADNITAGTITTNTITAAMANVNSASIGRANINYAKIVDASIDQLITKDAVAEKYYIDKLMVRNLQVIEQTVGNLVIKASDGEYYRLDIAGGTVTPTQVTVSAGEIAAGVTSDGRRSIIETDLTVADLSASSVKAINALIDKITASRIEVDTLVARDAFIQALRTSKIIGDKTITMIAADASDAKTAASGAQSTANTAQTTATAAQSTATAAQSTATAAQSTATAAQATANAAQQTANAKTTQFYQPVEPAAALTGDIWTNTNADRVLRKDGTGTNTSSTQEAYSIPVPGNVYSVQPTIIGGKSVVQSGELISADIEAVKSIGFNLLNPDEFEPNTRIYVSSGSALSYSGLTASGWIEALPDTAYYLNMPSIGSSYAGTAFYDANKRYISGVAHTRSSSYTVGILTTPSNCAYMRTCWPETAVNLCVNVSDVDLNGQFTEFTPVQSFPIPAEVRAQYPLRSVGTVRDSYEYDAIDGTWSYVQRVGSIDLGTPQWTTTGVSIVRFITADGTAVNSDWSDGNNTLCSRYAPHYNSGGYTDPEDKFVFIDGNGRIVVSDSEYSDGASLKAALNGVMLYFELAAPVTVDITDLMPVCNIVNAQQGGQIVFAQAETALAVPSTLMLSPWRDITEEADALALAAQDDAAVAQSSADEARRIAELAAAGVDETRQVIRIETDGLYLYPGKRTESGIEINTDGYHQRFTNRSQRVQRSGTVHPDFATSNRVIILGTQAIVRTVDGGTGFRLATADDYAALGE